MTTLTFPLSRIEGHARVVVDTEGGEVFSAQFQAMELRGFRYFVIGTPAEQMPVIVPRICGVCSTAHHVAAVKALENMYGVTPTPLADVVREVLLLGQLIQNQATSLFLFTMPDRVGASSLFHMTEDEASKQEQFSIAQRALKVRKIGTDLITLAGGQFIHPINTVIGGVTSGIDHEKAEKMVAMLDVMIPMACELVESYHQMSMALYDRIGTWGDDEPTHYLTSTEARGLTLNSKRLRVMGTDGTEVDCFDPSEYESHLEMKESRYSYAGESTYQGHLLRANSLARVNMTEGLGTPMADRYLARFREDFGRPAHAILYFDLCRGIELVYAMERARELVSEPLDCCEPKVGYTPRDGVGYGLVEAPRGPLIHRYVVENGLVKEAAFVIPTAHNMGAIRRALMVVSKRYITPERINLELEKAVGRVVRAFDPCIACATQ